ncbi:MAG: hypothetical protein M3032_11650 [Verrucomicrobiota bacterium]|nr:hypothetical protein [Verrucomicrobiota bacterium]
MKKLVSVTRATPVAASIGVMLAITAAVAFWITTSPTHAQGQCTVCHKRSQTLTFPCGSLQYNGHLAHGDPMGPCAVTPVENP